MAEEFERIVEQFIEKVAIWDSMLPAETLFAAWEELVKDASSLEVQATLVGDELVLENAPENLFTTRGNHIRLEDGRELGQYTESCVKSLKRCACTAFCTRIAISPELVIRPRHHTSFARRQ
jgi:hypothetical protein